MQALLQRWIEVLGWTAAARAEGERLLARYAEPHRAYHDQRHLREVLDALRRLCTPASGTPAPGSAEQAGTPGRAPERPTEPAPALRLAAWWHDAVYDPGSAGNERASADLAVSVLGALGCAPLLVEEVVRLVLLTETHRTAPGDHAGALLCDADLAILAAPSDRYAAYTRGIRSEYAHLDDQAFGIGRAQVLTNLLDVPSLYATEHGRQWWEARARSNVTAELTRLLGST